MFGINRTFDKTMFMSAVGTVWTPSILDPREREERRHRRCKQMKDVYGDKESSTKQKTRVASLPSPLNLTGNQWSRNNRRVAWFYICTFFMAAVLSEKKKNPQLTPVQLRIGFLTTIYCTLDSPHISNVARRTPVLHPLSWWLSPSFFSPSN